MLYSRYFFLFHLYFQMILLTSFGFPLGTGRSLLSLIWCCDDRCLRFALTFYILYVTKRGPRFMSSDTSHMRAVWILFHLSITNTKISLISMSFIIYAGVRA